MTVPNRPTLSLHIPEPSARPGEAPSFAQFDFGTAGAVRRPDSAEPETAMRDLPYELIRVLDEDGKAVGPWNPRLSPDVLKRGLRAMLLTRIFDDRLFRAHRQGKTSFYMKSTGEEAIGAAQSMMLGAGDMCFPTYRVLSWLMARDYPVVQLANQIFSNADDPIKGRQLPMMFSARDYGFYSLSGNLGTRFGHAVGWAMASAYKHDDKIAIAYVGDGTTAEGDFHEALTFASVYQAPVILCVTNNQWAISSFVGFAGGDKTTFAAKATAYALPGLRVDGNDFLAVWAATEWAAERARSNRGATLIEFFTYRVAGHSTSDDPTKYRPLDEPEKWPLGDPIVRLRDHLIAIGEWDAERHQALVDDVTQAVKDGVKQAEAVGTLGQSKPDIATMFEDIFAEPDWRICEERKTMGL
ncbi:thiamine pyrophosphate-dependent enzyme [Sphingobium subterraneum]|uniref:2-oxoisovalerate dehydrogenase subunit alpha n=1 Tax=Sphingobium subterraneum TaxID=627688 RepID=A0A841J1E3_9SPHN|nr:thiamine pyrophosphate-dependent enzyme [Sphingobium subterraneum]MBB6124647.1 2-oxoisovalerate dehydrogenase E1 component alpha subunit [Sphingobium subterraneum]